MRESDLQALIDEAVRSVVKRDQDAPVRQQASESERERLKFLLFQWLTGVERQRLQPFTVHATEEKLTHEISGLQLNLRIDRIDRLANGRLLLIDYKSGETSNTDLDNERPREPQLLVYASALGDEVDGMFFGQLKPRDQRLVGYSRQAQTNDTKNRKAKVRPDWYEFLNDRRSKIAALASAFVSGEAAVDPQKGACEYCACAPVCRVNERPQESEPCQ